MSKILNFLRSHWRVILTILAIILLLFIGAKLWHKLRQPSDIVLPVTERVVIVQPQGEQDVVIIGDPDKVNIKPKKNK